MKRPLPALPRGTAGWLMLVSTSFFTLAAFAYTMAGRGWSAAGAACMAVGVGIIGTLELMRVRRT